jgi:hypothetical protein
MKISGPGPKPPTEGPGGAQEANPAQGPAGKFADKMDKAAGAGATQSPEAAASAVQTQKTAATQRVADIGADLRAGKISPQTAVERVIDRVVARQVGPDAPPAVREQVAAALRQAIEDDPLLAEKLKGLTG